MRDWICTPFFFFFFGYSAVKLEFCIGTTAIRTVRWGVCTHRLILRVDMAEEVGGKKRYLKAPISALQGRKNPLTQTSR